MDFHVFNVQGLNTPYSILPTSPPRWSNYLQYFSFVTLMQLFSQVADISRNEIQNEFLAIACYLVKHKAHLYHKNHAKQLPIDLLDSNREKEMLLVAVV